MQAATASTASHTHWVAGFNTLLWKLGEAKMDFFGKIYSHLTKTAFQRDLTHI